MNSSSSTIGSYVMIAAGLAGLGVTIYLIYYAATIKQEEQPGVDGGKPYTTLVNYKGEPMDHDSTRYWIGAMIGLMASIFFLAMAYNGLTAPKDDFMYDL